MKKLLPVVHVRDQPQALEQVALARDAGADGAWLISHSDDHDTLWRIFLAVRREHPDFWLGLNFLDLSPPQAMALVGKAHEEAMLEHHRSSRVVDEAVVNGLWTDWSDVDDARAGPVATTTWHIKRTTGWGGLYFGGVAFKHQAPVADVARAARGAAEVMDVVTTSGEATGVAARVEKVAAMKEALEDHPLAVASGITPDNVGDYLPHVDYFLVATGISRGFHELDPDLVRALERAVHGSS